MADTSLSFFKYVEPATHAYIVWNIRLHSCLAWSIALRVHTRPLNIFIQRIFATAISHLRTYSSSSPTLIHGPSTNLKVQLSSPRMLSIDRLPGRLCYLLDSASFFNTEPGLLTRKLTIVDHSESFSIKNLSACELHTTNYYAAPEFFFETNANFHSDIWALDCLIYELRAGPLFIRYRQHASLSRRGNFPGGWKDFFSLGPCSI